MIENPNYPKRENENKSVKVRERESSELKHYNKTQAVRTLVKHLHLLIYARHCYLKPFTVNFMYSCSLGIMIPIAMELLLPCITN